VTGICKFCGCTDSSACIVPRQFVTDRVFIAALVAGEPAGFPCAWLLPDVCTAPLCVAKAYLEARAVVDEFAAELAAGRVNFA
jgi:hypothetical protein